MVFNGCVFNGMLIDLDVAGAGATFGWWIFYVLLLGYLFLGIAIVSDTFMTGIETITSQKRRVLNKKTQKFVTVHVWNDTVANLTLMALGSSAPEILLSCIEILSNGMFIGDLGAGTIIGSAAFNLLIISAVCVMAIPDGEVRYINQVSVYVITASCSVFAYIWLVFILMVTSPDVCEIWEGALTFLFFPILVFLAYLADVGYFDGHKKEPDRAFSKMLDKEELAEIEQEIRETHGPNLTEGQMAKLIDHMLEGKRTRAYYRHAAMGKPLGRANVKVEHPSAVSPVIATSDECKDVQIEQIMLFQMTCLKYAVMENAQEAKIAVSRSGPCCTASVKYKTRDGSAKAGSDYYEKEGSLEFADGVMEQIISIVVINDAAYEEDEEFFVDIFDPSVGDPTCKVQIAKGLNTAMITIIDDDEPGKLRFKNESIEVSQDTQDKQISIIVERYDGASATVGCSWRTEGDTAVSGEDFEEATGTLEFEPEIQSATINITLKARGRYDRAVVFRVFITGPTGGASFDKESDGGKDTCICTVMVKASEDRKAALDSLASRVNWNKLNKGSQNWKSQFFDAVIIDQDEEEDGPPSALRKFMHYISIPWKLTFALIPPPDYCNGWVCFNCSLVMIGIVTALVGDVAGVLGCAMGIAPEITAITFVAMGTSLPDTFASKTAAAMDPYADASIGNVTGSNSVNVFLGLGMPWTMAAIYWAIVGQNTEWVAKLAPGGPYADVGDNVMKFEYGVFVVPAGTLWFNLVVFSVNALCAIAHLACRRKWYGGELGGPRRAQISSATFLGVQWFVYVALSSMWVSINESD